MSNESRALGLGTVITRRDFVGATLIGSGAMLLGAPAPSQAQSLTSAWNGHAGIGRIAFGHSELSGRQSWGRAAQGAQRASKQILELT